MSFPALLVLAFVVLLAAVALVLRRRPPRDMIERQRHEVGVRPPAPPPRMDASQPLAPETTPSDEAALLAIPEIRTAIERGRKIEAVRRVREATGLGLKEAKELVERQMRR